MLSFVSLSRKFDLWSLIRTHLGPTTPYSGVENGKFGYIGYTGVFNVLDYPAVSFPCGVSADKIIDAAYPSDESLGKIDEQIRKDCKLLLLHFHAAWLTA